MRIGKPRHRQLSSEPNQYIFRHACWFYEFYNVQSPGEISLCNSIRILILLLHLFPFKVAEHSFRLHFCWCNSARAQGLQKTNMPSIERSFYLLNTRSICAIFLYNWTQRIDGFSLLLRRYVRKGNVAKNPAILSFFFLTERTQLNAAHA